MYFSMYTNIDKSKSTNLKQRDYEVLIPFFVSPDGLDTPFLLANLFFGVYYRELPGCCRTC